MKTFWAACALLAGSVGLCYGQAVNATLLGTVTDSSGASVANAKVTVTETTTGVNHSGQTNDSGNFTFPNLPPGSYSVAVEQTGFKKETRRDIALLVDTTTRVDIQLTPGSITESIEVTGAPPLLQTDTAPARKSTRPWSWTRRSSVRIAISKAC
jgi:hypothetical protein